MKRSAVLLAVPVLAGSMTLSACGGGATETSTTTTTATAAGSSAATAAAGATTSAAATECPTDNTRAFPKARFVADVGLAAGTFHRWIYKPYKAGAFEKGKDGRTLALVKAGTVAALDLKLINNAYENVQADPTLCKALKAPLGKLKDSLNGMKSDITSGDLSSVAATESVLSNVLGTSKQQGLMIQETTDESVAK